MFLVSNRMLTFIDCTLHIIKKSHNEFIGGFHVIMKRDFY